MADRVKGLESAETIGPQMNGIIKVMKLRSDTGAGFGFITPADGSKDIFFHSDTCIGGLYEFKALYKREERGEKIKVSFKVQDSPKGPMAVDVILDTSKEAGAIVPKTEGAVAGILDSKEIVADSPECSLEDEAFRIDSMGWKETVLEDFTGNLINVKVNSEGDIWELDNGVQIFTSASMDRETKKAGREQDIMTAEQAQWLLKNTPNNIPEGCKFAGFLNSKDGKIYFNQENACYWIGETNEKGNQKALFCIDISTVDEEMRPYTDEMVISDYDTKSAMQVRLLKKKTTMTHSIVSGTLPEGLILNATTGLISGTPTNSDSI